MNHKNKIKIKAISFNSTILKIYSFFLSKLAKKLNCRYSISFLPKKSKKIILLKSPHVHKKAREQFQVLTYSFILILVVSKVSEIISYTKLNSPKTINTKFIIQKN